MFKHLAKLLCLVLGALCGLWVRAQMRTVFMDDPMIPWGGAAVALVLIFVLLYFPLLRPLADMLAYRTSSFGAAIRSNTTGTGIDQVPERPSNMPKPHATRCGMCGGPGGPVCPRCHDKMARNG